MGQSVPPEVDTLTGLTQAQKRPKKFGGGRDLIHATLWDHI
jgi:hypothetical protein